MRHTADCSLSHCISHSDCFSRRGLQWNAFTCRDKDREKLPLLASFAGSANSEHVKHTSCKQGCCTMSKAGNREDVGGKGGKRLRHLSIRRALSDTNTSVMRRSSSLGSRLKSKCAAMTFQSCLCPCQLLKPVYCFNHLCFVTTDQCLSKCQQESQAISNHAHIRTALPLIANPSRRQCWCSR